MQDATFVDSREDMRLVAALRAGDEDAFRRLVRAHHSALVRLARRYVASEAVAEDVAQDTWTAVLKGLDGFEGRSSLRTWIFRILVNLARTRGARESRVVPFASLASAGNEPAVDPDRFDPGGFWASAPHPFGPGVEQSLLDREVRERIEAAIEALPPAQATVIRLRDVEGWGSDEVREMLDISAVNQRVLLHRARSRVRQALEDYIGDAA